MLTSQISTTRIARPKIGDTIGIDPAISETTFKVAAVALVVASRYSSTLGVTFSV